MLEPVRLTSSSDLHRYDGHGSRARPHPRWLRTDYIPRRIRNSSLPHGPVWSSCTANMVLSWIEFLFCHGYNTVDQGLQWSSIWSNCLHLPIPALLRRWMASCKYGNLLEAHALRLNDFRSRGFTRLNFRPPEYAPKCRQLLLAGTGWPSLL